MKYDLQFTFCDNSKIDTQKVSNGDCHYAPSLISLSYLNHAMFRLLVDSGHKRVGSLMTYLDYL